MWVTPQSVADILSSNHYLGPTKRGFAWQDDYGVIIFAKPTSRRLPQDGTWLELVRWCLKGIKNGGSRQWRAVSVALIERFPEVTTVVSYSDPAHGHTGALYRACNWKWFPTWHRLRTPPTGNGTWGGKGIQSAKDRWIFEFSADDRRADLLRVNDESLVRKGIPTYKEFISS